MAQLSTTQRRWRTRIEAGITLAAPALDLLLMVGDRLSRAIERGEQHEAEAPIPPSQSPTPRRQALADGH